MLPKRQRLTSSGVQRVLKKPFRGTEGPFRYSWRENTVGYPRCAVVVTKANIPLGSVQRNRLRRVLYAALEEVLHKRVVGMDVVVFFRATTESVQKGAVVQSLGSIIGLVEQRCGVTTPRD